MVNMYTVLKTLEKNVLSVSSESSTEQRPLRNKPTYYVDMFRQVVSLGCFMLRFPCQNSDTMDTTTCKEKNWRSLKCTCVNQMFH